MDGSLLEGFQTIIICSHKCSHTLYNYACCFFAKTGTRQTAVCTNVATNGVTTCNKIIQGRRSRSVVGPLFSKFIKELFHVLLHVSDKSISSSKNSLRNN